MTYRTGARGRPLRYAFLTTVASLALASAAIAQARHDFDIPAQDAASGLQTFARQSGRQILFPFDAVADKRTPAIQGNLDEQDVLDRLAAAAGLMVSSDDGRTITLQTRRATANAPRPQTVSEPVTEVDEIVVVGSQIRGSSVTAALPVTLVGEAEIANTAAVSGDELFRTIPQMGDVTFNASYLPGLSNSARGDTGSVNLRNLGVGNTLVLLNGRRVVGHPTSQANEHLVPVLTYNTNAIPVSGLRRLEVLRDGAAAIYGADAVAGVVNTVLRDDLNDWTVSTQYGGAEGTKLREFNFNVAGGRDIADGRGNVSLFVSYDKRDGQLTTERDYTASNDRRALFADTRFANKADLDGRSILTPWGLFRTVPGGVVSRNGVPVTSAAGDFHIQPDAFSTCKSNIGSGLCLDSGAIATSGAERDLRYDSAAEGTSVIPDLERVNVFLTGRYDLSEDITAFGEFGIYRAETNAIQAPITTQAPIVLTIPAHSYYNPFGPITFADGSLNPNRLSGLSGVPAEGLDIMLRDYTFADVGRTNVKVTNDQYRVLGGFRGEVGGWNWETAMVFSGAKAEDVSDNISTTALHKQLSLSTPDAYNPFNGGNLSNYSVGDSTPSSPAAIEAIRQKLTRKTESTLVMWDLKFSRPDVFRLPGGDVGLAAGVEYRYETQRDDRDSRMDGTITFTDASGEVYSDLINSALNPDIYGKREVSSAYAELAVPIISPEQSIPFVHRLEAQLAGRYENYSDFGDVAKPKIALAWDLVDGFRLRGSWAQGFRAPNLEQINTTVITRENNSTDWIHCQVWQNTTPGVNDFSNCTTTVYQVAERRTGNRDLKPEESETFALGAVIQPRFLPEQLGDFTFTIDYWKIEQEGLVGVFRGQNALVLDYYLRKQGRSNPNVIRDTPTPDEVALFTAAGLDPAGRVLYVNDRYDNMLPQEIQGVDLGVFWKLNGTRFGDFNVNLNVAHLLKYYLSPSPAMQELIDAQAAGDIDQRITFGGQTGDLIRQGAKPEWKWSASATWHYENFTLGAFTSYTGSVESTGSTLRDADGPWIVDAQLTGNLYGEYEFSDTGPLSRTRVRLGVRNITNEDPPLAGGGYLGTLYSPYSRYWYASLRKVF